jgi:hypothetical protein
MPSFAQGPNQSQRPASSDRARSDMATPTLRPRANLDPHLQRTIGNQAALRIHAGSTGPAVRAVQTKLAINTPGDEFEQEADRVAEQVMRMPEPRLQRACACDEAGPEHQTEKLPQGDVRVQTKRIDAGDRGQTAASPLIDDVLSAPGRPLDTAARAFMEPRFEYDFSQVRVHSDESAARSARDIAANAYTVGNHIVFNTGKFDPDTGAGNRLLAHELTHVIQQNAANTPSLQRDDEKGGTKDKGAPQQNGAPQQPAPAKPEAGTAYFHLVVRDTDLDQGGGVLVVDLAAAKAKLMQRKIDKPWTLVLAVHASENRLAAQSAPDWQKNAIFYDESAIKALFGGDSAFVTWRDQFGPNRVVLYGCQVTAAFEQTVANNLSRGGKAPNASGLGEGCKPLATTVTFGVNSRREYDKLSDTEKEKMLGEVQTANTTWGYYGGPPVPNDEVLDYLFKGPKPGSWSQVEVIVKQGDDFVSAKPPIPYWNRLSNSTFLHQCTKAVGNLRQRGSTAPTVNESE